MKYTVEAIKYIFKNFLYLLPFAIVPAFFLSLSLDDGAIHAVVGGAFKGDLSSWSFTQIFRAVSVLNFGSFKAVFFGLCGVILIVPCVALTMALLEKHFRIGKRTFNGIWSKLNDNIISTGGYAILVLLVYEFWSLLLSAVLYFVSLVAIKVLAYILIGIFLIVFHVVLLYIISAIYLWLPCMQITGFRAYEALQYSYQLLTPMKWRLTMVQLMSIVFVETLIALCAVFLPYTLLFTILTTALYAFLLMIYCVRMQIVYFDRDQIERADLNRFY